MCLPDFIRFDNVEKENSLIGYRNWRCPINDNNLILKSEHIDYIWSKIIEGPHEVKESNSGIYSYNYYYYNNYYNNYNNNYYNNYYNNNNYNNYYNNNNNYYNYYNNNYYYNNYNNYYNYYIAGIVNQWGRIGIHKVGQRSEYASINKLFSIKETNAKGSIEFIDWVKKFNELVAKLAAKYECEVISWQDYKELMENNKDK